MTYEEKNWLAMSSNNVFDFYLPIPYGLCYHNMLWVIEFPNIVDGGKVLEPVRKEYLVPHRH